MKKWTKLVTFYSVAVLASVSPITAFADDASTEPSVVVTPVADDTTVPATASTVVTQPTESTETVTPTNPDVTVPTTTEPTPSETTPTTPPATDTTVPSTEEKPSESSETPTTPIPAEEDKTSEKPAEEKADTETTEKKNEDGSVTVPTTDGKETTLTPDKTVPTNNPNVSAETADKAGASQVGTTSSVTGQVVSDVSPSAPVYTNTGYQIVSTQNSQVVVANSDGSTATVAPEVVGGVVNADKTITIKTNTGETKTLPTTGENENAMFTVAGFFTMLGAFLLKKKMVKDN